MSAKAHFAIGQAYIKADLPAVKDVIERHMQTAGVISEAVRADGNLAALIVSRADMLTIAGALYLHAGPLSQPPDVIEGWGEVQGWIFRGKAHKFNLLIRLFGVPLVCER